MVKMINPFVGTIYENSCLSKIDFDNDQEKMLSDFLNAPKNLMFVYSGPGVGKTYFAAAVTNMRISQEKYCWYMEEKQFFNKINSCMSNNGNPIEKLEMICDNEFIILDDFGSTRGNDEGDRSKWLTTWQKDLLFSFVDIRVKYALPTIITSNYSLQDLSAIFHERMISRLGATKNKIIKLKGFDKRQEGL